MFDGFLCWLWGMGGKEEFLAFESQIPNKKTGNRKGVRSQRAMDVLTHAREIGKQMAPCVVEELL